MVRVILVVVVLIAIGEVLVPSVVAIVLRGRLQTKNGLPPQ